MNRSSPSFGALIALSAAAWPVAVPPLAAAEPGPDPAKLPPAADRPVDFKTDIQPLFERSCLRCHGAERPRSGFRLDHRESALAGGDLGVDIIPGDSARSPLVHYIARVIDGMEMPPSERDHPLSEGEVGLIRRWIDDGASWDSQPAGPRIAFSVTPAVQFYSVSGNEARFREHVWTREGWGGGASEFSLEHELDPRTRVEMDGRVLAGREEYHFDARVERDNLGWARLAYREFTRFDDDTGGYYAPLGTEAPSLGSDLELTRRHATLEIGLALPRWPSIRVAYDLEQRQGDEAILAWGAVTQDGATRSIFPARKAVDETTHRVALELQYDLNGLLITDEAEFEWHEQDNTRFQRELASPPFDYATAVTDRQDSWRGANMLRLERNVRDWLHVSGGYLYSRLRDEGVFALQSFVPSNPSLPPSLDIASDDITLRRESHVANANVMLGPWKQLHVYAGVQADWSRQESFAAGSTFGIGAAYDSNIDRAAVDETFGLRYEGIPMTVLFAEARLQQESYSHFEEGLSGADQTFLRDTDADGDLREFEAGFTVSPWRWFSFQAKYRRRDRSNDYDHLRDIDLFSSGNGYPAFIRARDTATDEVEARLVVKPVRWLKATLKYSVAATDFETETESWEDFRETPPAIRPAGTIRAGEYDAHAITAGLVFTPWTRLHFASTIQWATSRSLSGISNGREVVPYEGDTWNVLNSGTLIVDERTDLFASYLFSCADFEQDNPEDALPLGIRYSRHAVTVGVLRRLKHDRLLRLEYGFFNYDEPTLGGAADYTAHGLFASLRLPWH